MSPSLLEQRDAQIPKDLKFANPPEDPSKWYKTVLTPAEIEIVELDATGLAQAIAAKTYTAVQVTEAYIRSAALAHAATNCLAWFDPEGARKRAQWLDEQMAKSGPVGPFHGVPVSIKDFFKVKGFQMSGGHMSSGGYTPDQDADLVGIFRAAGAVFMAKTTMPQSIMHLETSSFLGVTTNSHSNKLTSGGSSGGEGALVACHGSPIGITTDIGGSTRNPAANNGLFGFKPGSKRMPRDGTIGITSVSRISGSIGPVCHSTRDIDLFFKTVFAAQTWKHDIKLVPLGWRDVQDGKGIGFNGWSGEGNRLRVGVMRDDGVVRPVKPIRRALDTVIEKMKASSLFEIVEVEPNHFEEGWEITSRLYYVDGGKKLREAFGDEPLLPLTQWLLDQVSPLDLDGVERYVARRNALRQEYYDMFNSLHLDVILTPAGPAPAQPVGTTKYWAYTSMWNLLDWPAAVFPTGLYVDSSDAETAVAPKNASEAHLYSTYTPHHSPIGLQLVTPRWQDERLLDAIRVVHSVL